MHYPLRYHNHQKRPRYICRSLYRRKNKFSKIEVIYEELVMKWTEPPSIFETGPDVLAMNVALKAAFGSFLTARHHFQQKDHCYNHKAGYQCTDAFPNFDDTSDLFRELLRTFQEEGEDGINRIIKELDIPAATRFYDACIPMIEEIFDYMYASLIVIMADSKGVTFLADATLSADDVLRTGGLTPEHVKACREYIEKGEDA